MKQSEALQIINNLIIALQKTRSNALEALAGLEIPNDTELWVLQETFPYTHGPKSILPPLMKVSERGAITPQDLYNFLTLIDMKGSDIEAMYVVLGFGVLPERQTTWLTEGWEPETDEPPN